MTTWHVWDWKHILHPLPVDETLYDPHPLVSRQHWPSHNPYRSGSSVIVVSLLASLPSFLPFFLKSEERLCSGTGRKEGCLYTLISFFFGPFFHMYMCMCGNERVLVRHSHTCTDKQKIKTDVFVQYDFMWNLSYTNNVETSPWVWLERTSKMYFIFRHILHLNLH